MWVDATRRVAGKSNAPTHSLEPPSCRVRVRDYKSLIHSRLAVIFLFQDRYRATRCTTFAPKYLQDDCETIRFTHIRTYAGRELQSLGRSNWSLSRIGVPPNLIHGCVRGEEEKSRVDRRAMKDRGGDT